MPRHALPTALTAGLMALASSNPAFAADEPTPEQARFFESQVRPVLVESCAKCHAGGKSKGGLKLDSRGSTLAGGDTGPAIVPGKSGESLLIAAVKYEGPEMPPNKKLPKEQVAALSKWVDMGAPWPGSVEEAPAASTSTIRKQGYKITDKDREHWAFRPVAKPAVPSVKDAAWVRNPVDAFILSGLESKGLRPNPPASKPELIRRATYDLTGLPASPQEVEAFVKDESPDAYEKLVDRLLTSPRYGEAWARHWLDLVRFAETNSYERDGAKPSAWRYRDYVIRSLNDDKPYDRFVREQLAGDELADGGIDGKIATGYYRLGIWDDEPSDRDQALFDGFDDIVATTSQVFLGLTVDCARCHDHKIDPIPQKDYYKLVAFFRNITPYRNGGPTDEAPIVDPSKVEEYRSQERELARRKDEIQGQIGEIEGIFRRKYAAVSKKSVASADLDDLHYRFYRDSFEKLPDFDALKFEDSAALPRGLFDIGPRTRNESIGFVFEGVLVVPEDGSYTFSLDSDDGSRLSIDGKPIAEYDGIHGEGEPKSAATTLDKGRHPIRLDYFQLRHGLGLTVTWSGPGFATRPLSATDSEDEEIDVATLMRSQGERILGADLVAKYRGLRRELNALKAKKPGVETALCVTEVGPKPIDTFVLSRGNPHTPADRVEPGFLAVLGSPEPSIASPDPSSRTTGRRLALADWIVSPANPLPSRVLANRLWQHHFGRGIVRSPNNFGTQGDRPTHPELLDWLASELISGGWRMKPIHRLIMTSNAYRMSSRSDPEALAKDPINDAFWRFDMRRLTGEEIRDSVLAVSGVLNAKMYGPGVYPEIPREVMAGQSVPGAGWGKSPPEEQARRSIYVHVKRSLLLPILESFDLPETDRSSPVRFSTTQPTQALGMLNGSFLRDQAALFAARVRKEAGDDPADQVRLALKLATGREPGDSEVRRGVDLIASLSTRPGVGPDEARKAFCLVVLNLDEFLYLD